MFPLFLMGFTALTIIFVLYTRYIIRLMFIPRKLAKAKSLIESREEDAMRILSVILSIDRGNPEANWTMARLYIKRKQYILAQLYLNEILYYNRFTSEISEISVRETLAYIYQAIGEINKALAQYYLLKKHNKLNLLGMKKSIKLNIDNNNYREATELLSQALKLYPKDGELYFLDGMIDYHKGNFKSAERKLKNAIQKGYNNPEANILLGKIYFITRKFKLALDILNELPERYLSSPDIENLLGQCFYHIKDYNSAIVILEKLIHQLRVKDKLSPDSMYILGCAYECNGDIEKAVKTWQEIEQKFPFYQPVKEKINFYTDVISSQKMKELIVSPFIHFAKITERLIDALGFTIKQNIYEDEKNLEYLCLYQKDPHPFNLYLINITRSTSPVNIAYINQKILLLNRYRAKYPIIISPLFSDDAIRFAELNSVTIYKFDIYEKYNLI